MPPDQTNEPMKTYERVINNSQGGTLQVNSPTNENAIVINNPGNK